VDPKEDIKELEEEIKKLKKINSLQESALNIVIMAYWSLYYNQTSFPGAESIRRIESKKKEWKMQ